MLMKALTFGSISSTLSRKADTTSLGLISFFLTFSLISLAVNPNISIASSVLNYSWDKEITIFFFGSISQSLINRKAIFRLVLGEDILQGDYVG